MFAVEFLAAYGLFFAKLITFAVIVVIVLTALVGGRRQQGVSTKSTLKVRALNKYFKSLNDTMQHAVLEKQALKQYRKAQKKSTKAKQKSHTEEVARKRLYVMDFTGDIKASATTDLREQVSALLGIVRKEDEVVVRLESAGGFVHSYGLAASQLKRIRDQQIPLTVVVDKVAASGGYMMACVADKLISAPFAVIGSIGVVAQIPNVHRLLKKHDVDVELLTAGKYKRTLTMLGENTSEGREKFIEDLEQTHGLFKAFITTNRAQVDIETVATGEVWYGQQALEKNLVDHLQTSDEYLLEQAKVADIFELSYEHKPALLERLGFAVESGIAGAWNRIWEQLQNRRFFS